MADLLSILGIVIPAVGTLAKPIVDLLIEKYKARKNSLSLADVLQVLNYGLEKLRALQRDKEDEVLRHSTQKDSSHDYERWTDLVLKIEGKVASLNKDYDEVGTKKRHFLKRPNLEKEIKGALGDVIKLVQECPQEILVAKRPERVKKVTNVPEIKKYPTLKDALNDILDKLQKERLKCVALKGDKGVGKTTIVQHLNNHFYDKSIDKEFDLVILIEVKDDEHNENLHILLKIAERIKVDIEGAESDVDVAGRIQKVLEKKRYLLILDGVRRAIDEIWRSLDISNDKRDSKVVITTCYPLVVQMTKCVDVVVKLGKLPRVEAWKMFRHIVGKDDLPPPAYLVCQRLCCCLPLLINPIAKSFKYKECPYDWEEALGKGWPFEVDPLKELYSILETCYEQLGDESKQKCFLYASLYPANSNIYTDYYVECCIVQGFLGDVDANKYSEMRSRAIDFILKHLVNAAFFVGGEQMRYVKMNDLYRKLALYISSKGSDLECKTFVDNEEPEEVLVRSESWQHARRVSMVGSERDSVPTKQDCGSLWTVLYLQKNLKLVEFPSTFFYQMGKLLILNLYGTEIRSLPSLQALKSLKAFYLNGCSHLIISPCEITPLECLEIFDVRGSGVNFVPCLKRLRCLRISYTASGNYVEISKLHKLEELNIEVTSLCQSCDGAAKIIIDGVASLENLTTFRCNFPSSDILRKFLQTSKSWRGKKQFASFQFFVGCENSKHPKIIEYFDGRISKYVKYNNGDTKDDLAITEVLTEVLPQAEAFELICHMSVGSLLELVNTSSLKCLRWLLIEGCDQMSTLVAGDMVDTTLPENACLLPNLEQLRLDNLRHLSIVFKGPFYRDSFIMLRTLTLENCSELTSIFSETATDDFPLLQKLVVKNCSKFEILIKVNEKQQSVLPSLEILVLDNLLKFKYICPNENLAWDSLEEIKVQKCPELKALPFNKTNAACLRTIECEKECWSNLGWTHHEVRERFEYAFVTSS